ARWRPGLGRSGALFSGAGARLAWTPHRGCGRVSSLWRRPMRRRTLSTADATHVAWTACDRHRRLLDARTTNKQRDHCSNQEHHKKDLGDASGASGNAAKTQDAGDDRDYEEYDCVVKHEILA